MIRETTYDDVFDAQRHFRTLLDSMSRPGKLNRFAPVAVTPPAALHRGTVYTALALLNADVCFHAGSLGADAAGYLRANTQSREEAIERADFVFLHGGDERASVDQTRIGIATYPETGATVVIQVEHVGKSSSTGGLQLTLEGPGIETREIVFVTGLRGELIDALREKNVEFPLGVDAILVSADDCVLCLPRTTRITASSL